MEIKAVSKIEKAKTNDFDFDGEEIYETKTGKTISDISFKDILDKLLNKNNRQL